MWEQRQLIEPVTIPSVLKYLFSMCRYYNYNIMIIIIYYTLFNNKDVYIIKICIINY